MIQPNFHVYPMSFREMQAVIAMEATEESIYQEFVKELNILRDEIRSKWPEQAKSVAFRFEYILTVKTNSSDTIGLGYRLVFTLPNREERTYWCVFDGDGYIERIEKDPKEMPRFYVH
jgi:hypothetical protein